MARKSKKKGNNAQTIAALIPDTQKIESDTNNGTQCQQRKEFNGDHYIHSEIDLREKGVQNEKENPTKASEKVIEKDDRQLNESSHPEHQGQAVRNTTDKFDLLSLNEAYSSSEGNHIEKDSQVEIDGETSKEANMTEEKSNIESKSTNKKSKCCLCGAFGKRCAHCQNIVLCEQCLPRHLYLGRCLPWTIKNLPDVGRCLVATRTIKPLEVVIEDSAVLTVPVNKMSCLGCGRGVNCAYLCPSCSLPMCGTECPRAETHKIECPLLKGLVPERLTSEDKYHPIFTVVGIIRFLQMKKEDPQNFSKIANLDPKKQKIITDQAASDLLSNIKNILGPLMYSNEDVEHAYAILKLYGYNLPDVPDSKVRSLFPVQSLLSHSCLPNLQYIEKVGGRKIVLQSTTKIEKGDLLTVRFSPFLQGRITLTKWLAEKKYVQCKCARCVDATELGTFTSSALCDRKDCLERGGLVLPVDPAITSDWICSSCQTITSNDKVEEIEEKYINRFRELQQGDLNEYYTFLNELGERFHASHHLVMRMAQFLVLLQGKRLESLSRERIETQSLLCDKLLAYVSRLDPGATQNRAKLLLEKNKADLNLAKLDCEAGKITRKVFMARIKEGVKVEVNAKKILYFKWNDQ